MAKINKLKIIPLGGLGEIGKNITVHEYKDSIVIVDCGMTFPEDEMLGVDIVIPDVSYLIKNKDKIKGLVLTHGHEDHIGAIPYVLKKINMPIYGTKLTLGLLANKLKEHNLKNIELNVVNYGENYKLGHFDVEFIKTTHSIPDSAAIALTSPVGTVIQTGDFKIDFTPIEGAEMNLNRFAELGDKGILALLSDSTNVTRPGYTVSERMVGETFRDLFYKAEGRIIVATFSSNVYRVQQVIDAAELNDRKVILSGRSMINVSTVARELGYLRYKEGTIIDIKDMGNYRKDEIVLIMTGSQGEPMSALTRISSDEHRQIELMHDDLVLISATPIPGNEKAVSKTVNKLLEKGIKVIYEALDDIHVSGHACQEELKLMHSLVKPKFFVPVHGEIRHLKLHAELSKSMGMPEENIFVLENGQSLEFTKNSASLGVSVPSGHILVDGLGVGDVGNIVLRDRKHLSEDGLIVVVVTMEKSTGKVAAGPDLLSRGFVYVRESEDLMVEAKKIVQKTLDDIESKKIKEWSTIKSSIRNDLRTFLYGTIKRNPMILPIIMEI